MGFGIFMHKEESIYDDVPAVQYQFPKIYHSRAKEMIGDWIVYLESGKVRKSRGYFAVAKVEKIVPDNRGEGLFLALIEKGTYLDFFSEVPFRVDGIPAELGLLNEAGKISGRAQSAVRPLSNSDFARIIALGLADDQTLPRVGDPEPLNVVREEQTPFEVERPLVQSLLNRPFRDRAFRRAVLHAYDGRCAVTGWRLVNGGGRLEAEAAHIRPVEHGGPDSIRNGLALSGTAHWMFDRGLIGVADNHEIIIHRKVNDRSGVESIINPTGKLIPPHREADHPHPQFLNWHREFHAFV